MVNSSYHKPKPMKNLPTRIFDAFCEGILDTAVFYSSDDAYLYRLDEYRQVFERLAKDADIHVIYYDFADVQASIYQHFMSHMIAAVCPNQADSCYSLRVVFEQIISGNQRYLLILDNIECLYHPSNLQSSEIKDFIGSLRTCLDVYRTNIRTAMLCRDTANLRKLYHDYREPFYCFGYLQDVGR